MSVRYEFGEYLQGKLEYPKLPGGAQVVETFPVYSLLGVPECDLSIHPHSNQLEDVDPNLRTVIDVVRGRFPTHRFDVSVRREDIVAGDPSSISTSSVGIHPDGYEDGFFVLSTLEPTVFYADYTGSLPKQALPGQLVYLRGDTYHSSPNPKSDGERVRIKIIPQRPLTQTHALPNSFVLNTLQIITLK